LAPAAWGWGMLAALPVILLYVVYDFPLHLRWFLWPPLLVFWYLWGFGEPGLLYLGLALYFFFTVILWGSVYYHLRIGITPWNFLRFWRLVLVNADSTSGNAQEQVPKFLLTLSLTGTVAGAAAVHPWAAVAAGSVPGTPGLTALALFSLVLALWTWMVHRWGFNWRPAERTTLTRETFPAPDTGRPLAARAVVVVIDGCRRDRWEEAHTPFMDWLRAQGTEFTRMETVYPARTVVCFASMFTGTYPREHGIHSNLVLSLGLKVPSLFDVLQARGRRGRLLGIAHLIDAFGDHVESVTAVMPNDEADGRITQRALEILAAGPPDLLVVQLIAVDQTGHSRGALYPEYREKIEEADRHIEQIYRWLEARGLAQDTLFIVCADHGQGDGIGGHGHLGEGERLVPFIMHGPGVRTGHRVDEPTQLVAVAPTLAYWLGLPYPERSRGEVLLAALTDSRTGVKEVYEDRYRDTGL